MRRGKGSVSIFHLITLESSTTSHCFSAHPHRYPIAPVTAHATPKGTSSRLRSLLFLIPSLKPVTNGTSAFAFQNPVICTYTAAVVATLTNATNGEALGRKNSVTELMRERNIYAKPELRALVPVMYTRDRCRPLCTKSNQYNKNKRPSIQGKKRKEKCCMRPAENTMGCILRPPH